MNHSCTTVRETTGKTKHKLKYPSSISRCLADAQYRLRIDQNGCGEGDVVEWERSRKDPSDDVTT